MTYGAQVGKRIKEIREQKDIYKSALAKKAGAAPEHIARIENGKVVRPRAALIRRIAEALDVPVSELDPNLKETIPQTEHYDQYKIDFEISNDSPAAFKELLMDTKFRKLAKPTNRELTYLSKVHEILSKEPTKQEYIDLLVVYRDLVAL